MHGLVSVRAAQAQLLGQVFQMDSFWEVDYWAYYPAANSNNSGEEVTAELSQLLAQHLPHKKNDPLEKNPLEKNPLEKNDPLEKKEASVKPPLLIRHRAVPKRHHGSQAGRRDPKRQIESLHLNPLYRDQLQGKVVVVLDDYVNHGLSFAVASAFLRRAGAKKIIGLPSARKIGVFTDIEL